MAVTASPLRLKLEPVLSRRGLVDAVLALALLFVTHAVYRASHGTIQLCDSTYSLIVSEKLLFEGTLDLRSCLPADAAIRARMPGWQGTNDMPYHLAPRGEHVFYGYPLGSSVLSLPFVWNYVHNRGITMLDASGVPSYDAEGQIQQRIASWVAALTAVVFFAIARCFCGSWLAALVALGFAFGSPLWSTLSRALWSHTWAVLWVAVAVGLLVASRRAESKTWKRDLAFGLALGTSLFWAAFCRQHTAISAIAIGAYLLLHNRRLLMFTMLGGGAWSAVLVAVSLACFGSVLPPSVYAMGAIDGKNVLDRFTWLMISPARGVLVFCPYLVVVAVLILGCCRNLANAGLLFPACLALLGQTLLFSCYNGWHANWAYGPRYFCDVLPWFVLITAMAVGAIAKLPEPAFPWKKAMAAVSLVLCFAWGTFVHARGAISKPAWHWNDLTKTLGDEGAVKDWSHPQFLAGLTFRVREDGSIEEIR
jgi:hypothetical protein